MSHFDLAFEDAIGLEGGYVNDPVDAGGETKFGITKRSYPTLDIAALTIDDAKAIYKRDWWERYNLDAINDARIAVKFFDIIINTGFKKGSEILQWALIACGHQVVVDGFAGKKTFAAVNATNPDILLPVLKAEQSFWYRYLVRKKPSQGRFYFGWLSRAYGFAVDKLVQRGQV